MLCLIILVGIRWMSEVFFSMRLILRWMLVLVGRMSEMVLVLWSRKVGIFGIFVWVVLCFR